MPDSIIKNVYWTTVDDIEYVALTIPYRLGHFNPYGGFIFKIEAGSPELIFQQYNTRLLGFDDRNGNGFPDIVLDWGVCDTCGGTDFYEIRSNGEVINLIENLNADITGFLDLESDGILELEGTQRIYVPHGVRNSDAYFDEIPRWFFWNGEEYEAYPTFEGE